MIDQLPPNDIQIAFDLQLAQKKKKAYGSITEDMTADTTIRQTAVGKQLGSLLIHLLLFKCND